MADPAVVRGQDDAHPILLGSPLGETERVHNLRHQLVGQPYVGLGIGDLLGRDVELACHRGHDLHQPAGPAARGDVGREPRFMVGDGAHQAPVVALFFADVANDIVISRDHIVALTEQRIAEIGRIVVQQHVVRHGCAELGVKAVKSRQDC